MQFTGKIPKCDVSLEREGMTKETKKSRPGDFVENSAATYMENNERGLFLPFFYTTAGLDAFQMTLDK